MRALSRDEVRSIDRCAVETLGIPGVVLMENAGRNAADAAQSLLAERGGRSAAVVAGAGNNAGDGFVIARHLDLRGFRAATFIVVPADRIAGDARINLDALCAIGGDIRHVHPDQLPQLGAKLAAFDLVVDAIGGTGVRGALRGEFAEAVRQVNASGRPVLAVDIPTGLDCDTGESPDPTVRAAMTVTFVARKKGLDAPGAERYTGKVVVADIGVPADRVARLAGVSL